jgi:glycosyltransferase involved in cell wall biosynthesis
VPRVSVIIPAHDSAATIGRTLRSVAAQGFQDWEAIVADDASSDATAELAAAVDPRVKVVHTESNVGPAGARNVAIEHATADLVAFLDADDRWEPQYLERQIERYEQAGDGVGIVACDAWMETADGTRIGRYSERFGTAEGITLAELLERNRIFISALCPRAVVDEVGRFSPECWGSEDHDLWIRIVERGYRVVANPDPPLAIYRVADGSVSSSRAGMARTEQATYRLALERGRLGPRERAIAARRLRLASAAERVEQVGVARALPRLARVAIENPRLWGGWLRRLTTERPPRG